MRIVDLVFDWMSETGAGTWDDAREKIAAVQMGLLRKKPAWIVASQLSDSGHLDVDWSANRWSTSRPALCVLPGTALCATWTGARPRRVWRDLQEQVVDLTSVFNFDIAQPEGLTASFIKAASVDELAECAARLDLDFVIDPANRLADVIPTLRPPQERAAALTPTETIQWFDGHALVWRPVEHIGDLHGLFRVERRGRREARWRDANGGWFKVDQPAGMFLSLTDPGPRVLRWRPPPADRSEPSYLEVREPMLLPEVARRAAVASSGLLPIRSDGWLQYRNVSQRVAKRIMHQLGRGFVTARVGD